MLPFGTTGKKKTLEAFPMLKEKGLAGGVVYYDGMSLARPRMELSSYGALTVRLLSSHCSQVSTMTLV